jgi:hypothetical protein
MWKALLMQFVTESVTPFSKAADLHAEATGSCSSSETLYPEIIMISSCISGEFRNCDLTASASSVTGNWATNAATQYRQVTSALTDLHWNTLMLYTSNFSQRYRQNYINKNPQCFHMNEWKLKIFYEYFGIGSLISGLKWYCTLQPRRHKIQ